MKIVKCEVFYKARPRGAIGILFINNSIVVDVSQSDIAKYGSVDCAARMNCIDSVYKSLNGLEHITPTKVKII